MGTSARRVFEEREMYETAKQHAPEGAKNAMEKLARAGFATKGLVYITLGILSVQAALGDGAPQGGQGAVRHLGAQPFGAVLLVVIAIGLVGYAPWRFIQAGFDPEGKGSDAKGVARRVGYALSGVSHSALAVVAAQMVLGGSDGGSSKRTYLAELMSHTGGQVVVALLGAFVIVAGLHQLYKAKTTEFLKELKTGSMSQKAREAAVWSGRLGLAARGIVFPIVGFYLIRTAITRNPSEAKGIAGALGEIGSSSFGTIMLFIVASGLVAYGVYQVVLSRYRRIDITT